MKNIFRFIYVSLLPLILGTIVIGRWAQGLWKPYFILVILVLLASAIGSSFLAHKQKIELLALAVLGTLFFGAMAQNDLIWSRYHHWKLVGIIVVLALSTTIVFLNLLQDYNISGNRIIKKITENGLFIGVLLLFFLLSFRNIYTYQLGDGFLYQQSLYDMFSYFDLWDKNIGDFMLYGHKSFAYSLWVGIGRLIIEHGPQGYLLMQVLAGVGAIYAFYNCLNMAIFGEKRFAALASAVFAFSPFFFGQECYFSLDFGMLCFGVIFFYVFLRKYYLLIPLMGLCFLYTKENATFLYAGTIAGAFVAESFINRKIHFSKRYLLAVLPGIMWLITYFSLGNTWGSYDGIGGDINTFAISTENILLRGKQFVFLNFNWLIIVLICFGLCYQNIRRESLFLTAEKNTDRSLLLGMVIGHLTMLLLFFGIFNTYMLPRYIMCVVVDYSFILSLVFSHIYKHSRVLIFVSGTTLAFLLMWQSYNNIDPISNRLFYEWNAGNGTILSCTSEMFPGDYMATNLELAAFPKTIERALQEGDYDQNTQIVTTDNGMNIISFNPLVAREWYWDSESKILVQDLEANSVIPISVEQTAIPAGSSVIVCLPTNEAKCIDRIKDQMIIEKEYEIIKDNWKFICLKGIWNIY